MHNFIRRLRAAYFFTRHMPYTSLPDSYWTFEDARSLSNFLTGDAGSKLRFILRNKVFETASRAIMETSDKAQYLCGFSAGVKSTVAEIDSLLEIGRTREGLSLSDEEMAELFKTLQ